MNVRAKFECQEINHRKSHDPNSVYVEVRFTPVIANNADNADWSKYTPHGEIKMAITNPKAVEQFELGGEYFVDFSRAK